MKRREKENCAWSREFIKKPAFSCSKLRYNTWNIFHVNYVHCHEVFGYHTSNEWVRFSYSPCKMKNIAHSNSPRNSCSFSVQLNVYRYVTNVVILETWRVFYDSFFLLCLTLSIHFSLFLSSSLSFSFFVSVLFCSDCLFSSPIWPSSSIVSDDYVFNAHGWWSLLSPPLL